MVVGDGCGRPPSKGALYGTLNAMQRSKITETQHVHASTLRGQADEERDAWRFGGQETGAEAPKDASTCIGTAGDLLVSFPLP